METASQKLRSYPTPTTLRRLVVVIGRTKQPQRKSASVMIIFLVSLLKTRNINEIVTNVDDYDQTIL